MVNYARFFKNIKHLNPREQADLLFRLGFSRDVALLNNNPNKFSQRLNENYQNSAIIEESIESLRRLNEKWIKAQNEFQTAGIKFTKTVAPILEFITDVLSEIAIQLGKLFDNPIKYLSETPQGKYVENKVKQTKSYMRLYDNNKINKNTRGEENNNPLNLEFRHQAGATKENRPNARFAKFENLSLGIKVGARQLLNYYHGQSASAGYQKLQTVEDIISKWAPKEDSNDTESYIASVAKSLGVRRNTLLDLNNPDVLYRLIDAMSRVETGKSLSNNKKIAMQAIGEALNSQSMITGRKSLGRSSMGLGSRNEYAQNSSSNINNETHIGSITVNTQATDAEGIAKDIGVGIKKEQATFAFNGGLF